MTVAAAPLADVQRLITNTLDAAAMRGKRLAAIVGESSSAYAKSPALWNAAFAALGVPAMYVALDVPAARLDAAVRALREDEAFVGGSVTVPYKAKIIPLLDDVDPVAARIGAVNVIARSPEGGLRGYNTDGSGGVRALTEGGVRLAGARVALIGAGGAAQALAAYLWDALAGGELTLINRHAEAARAIADRLLAARPGRVQAVNETAADDALAGADLVINATVKGQSGIRAVPGGLWTCLEPYSALAPANPASLPATPGQDQDFLAAWFRASREDVLRNIQRSLALCTRLRPQAVCYDIVYAPLETVFLRHARLSGHRTLSGRSMNLWQAVEAFQIVCGPWLAREGIAGAALTAKVQTAMAGVWGR